MRPKRNSFFGWSESQAMLLAVDFLKSQGVNWREFTDQPKDLQHLATCALNPDLLFAETGDFNTKRPNQKYWKHVRDAGVKLYKSHPKFALQLMTHVSNADPVLVFFANNKAAKLDGKPKLLDNLTDDELCRVMEQAGVGFFTVEKIKKTRQRYNAAIEFFHLRVLNQRDRT